MMTACVIWKWKKMCLMLELNTFSAVIIKLKTSRTTPIYQESALNQNYRRYNTDRGLRTYLQRTMLLRFYNNHKLISLDDKEEIISRDIFCSRVVTRGRYEVLRGSLQGSQMDAAR